MSKRIQNMLAAEEPYDPTGLSDDELAADRDTVRQALTERDEYTADELRRIVELGKAIKSEADSRAELAADIESLTIEPEPEEEPVVEVVEEPVVATLGDVKRPAASAPQPEPETEPDQGIPTVLVAAGGAPGSGRVDGDEIGDPTQLGNVMQAAWRNSAPPQNGSMWNRAIQKSWDTPHVFQADGGADHNYRTIREIQAEARADAHAQVYDGKPLQAASGICGPYTPQYDFFNPISATSGIIMLPEATVARGGIRIPSALTYDDLRDEDAIGGEYTSDDGNAGSLTKLCYTVECPTITDFEVIAYSNCLRFSNFQGRFFPEYVSDVTMAAQATHAHRVNRALIAAIVASGDTVAYVSANEGGGALVQFTRQVVFHTGLYRDKYRLDQGAILDVVFTYRAYLALLADVIARDSTTAATFLLDTFLTDFSRQAGVRLQFVYDWEDMTVAAGDFGAEDYPFLVFPPGEVIHITGGTLDVGVVRDSTRNANNEFDLFSETFDGIAVSGYEIMSVTGTVLCPDGATGARVTIDCATVGS